MSDIDVSNAQVVHTAKTPEQQADEANDATLRQKADSVIATIEANCTTKATWDGLTAAQRQEASRQGLLAVAKLARLVLRRLDAA